MERGAFRLNVTQGLEFILQHFEEPVWPRKISTYKSESKQFEVSSSQEALKHFEESNWKDCRITAFGKSEIDNEKSNLIFIDLDNKSALNEVLSVIHKVTGGIPTVLHTGNGFCLLLPINIIPMKGATHDGYFIEQPAKTFLSFAERYLSNSKCDTGNHPSLLSCLIRIPGSFNSKSIKKGNYEQAKVTIVQEWNRERVEVKNLPFKKHLDKIIRGQKKRQNRLPKVKGEIKYIENLLKRKTLEGRKRLFALVLCPYLINVKKLPIEQARQIIYDYFDGYMDKSLINYKLKEVLRKEILPYSLSKMQSNDKELHQIVTNQSIKQAN